MEDFYKISLLCPADYFVPYYSQCWHMCIKRCADKIVQNQQVHVLQQGIYMTIDISEW